MVSEPTRVTLTTASIIDHIFTNVSDLISCSGVLSSGFSDHLITFCTRQLTRQVSSGCVTKMVRSFKDYSKEVFVSRLSQVDWSSVFFAADVDSCLSEFSRIFLSVVELVAPLKEVRVRAKSNPWMNSHILAEIRRRDSLLARYRKDRGNVALYKEFCKARNAVQRDIKLAKQTYFKNGVEKFKGNSSKLWRHLQSLGYCKKAASSSSSVALEMNGVKVFDPAAVASIFNSFYTTVATSLVSKLPKPFNIISMLMLVFKIHTSVLKFKQL